MMQKVHAWPEIAGDATTSGSVSSYGSGLAFPKAPSQVRNVSCSEPPSP